ncbi:hypothetical protein T484DRAFT_1897994 [Baffinella frigidus]|nr:hypothetical protein T484DRAFT_1897994 [Cryptophyta sp. CCMP2293]
MTPESAASGAGERDLPDLEDVDVTSLAVPMTSESAAAGAGVSQDVDVASLAVPMTPESAASGAGVPQIGEHTRRDAAVDIFDQPGLARDAAVDIFDQVADADSEAGLPDLESVDVSTSRIRISEVDEEEEEEDAPSGPRAAGNTSAAGGEYARELEIKGEYNRSIPGVVKHVGFEEASKWGGWSVPGVVKHVGFEEASKWGGSRPGCVFKAGIHGLGYYADDGSTSANKHRPASEPTKGSKGDAWIEELHEAGDAQGVPAAGDVGGEMDDLD